MVIFYLAAKVNYRKEAEVTDNITVNGNNRNRFEDQIDKFLDEFISVIYKGHDHIIARKYYRDLFRELIPKYFTLSIEDE